MSGLLFKDDLDQLSETQLKLIRTVLERHNINNKEVLVEPVGEKGDNYIALVKRIVVETDKGPFKIIAKIAPLQEVTRQISNTESLFKNEIIIYSEVLSKFKEFFDAENIPHSEQFRIPSCFGYISDPLNEIILLEDLAVSDFILMDRFKPLSDDSIKLVLKDLAIFHSLSFVMKRRHPEMYSAIQKKLMNTWAGMDTQEGFKIWLTQLENDIISILETEKHKAKVKGLITNLGSNALKLFKYDLQSKYSVLLQGDCWTNNMLFRSADGQVVESVMIDYQLSKSASPAADILYLTLNCTDYQTRHKHQQEWIDFYYMHLGKSLDNFGYRVNAIYPRDQLDTELRMNGKLAFGLSVLLANVMARESEEAMSLNSDLKEEQQFEKAMENIRITNVNEKTLSRIKEKVIECLESCVEFGYL